MERLQKILSSSGVCSRREAERLISEGRVKVNGIIATLGQSADKSMDVISLDDKPIEIKTDRVYILLNKPIGYVTTMSDEKGRKNVSELVVGCGMRVYPVGRLDMYSEGALIMTNDGNFANMVMHPSKEKNKTYRVKVRGDVRSALQQLSKPFDLDGYITKPAGVTLVSVCDSGGVVDITIHEGRNRQVRRMCDAAGLRVEQLKRTYIGKVSLGNLKPGEWRYLTDEEVDSFLK